MGAEPDATTASASPVLVTTPPQTTGNQASAGTKAVPLAGGGSGLPYVPQPLLAAVFLGAALVVIFGTGLWFLHAKSWHPPGYTGGGAAAAAALLITLALVLRYPTLIMDDAPANGGEPSTMRILSLAIVLTFCLTALRTGWNSGTLPAIDSNWVWLVTAALGGKAVQKFAEIQDKK